MQRILLFGDSWGVPQLARALPRELVVGIVGAEIRPQYHAELRSLADSHQVSFLVQPRKDSASYPEFTARVSTLAPDLILVNSYSMLLQPEILDLPALGCINMHSALLPHYRGNNPIQWVIINNETQTGVTMHYMTAEFDVGDIVAQRRVPIYFEDTWVDLQTRCAEATEAMLHEELPGVLSGAGNRMPQSETGATYSRRRRPEDGLIAWEQSVLSIYNLIRALVRPLPGAFYYSGPNKALLDQYAFIPEVTLLKYSPTVGKQELSSGKVFLTPLAIGALPVMLDWLGKSAELSSSSWDLPAQTSLQEKWLETIRQRNDVVIFEVRLREKSELVGWGSLDNINYTAGSGNSHLWMNDAASPEDKLEKEALGLLLSFAFDDLNLGEIQLPDGRQGTASPKVSRTEFVAGRATSQATHANAEWANSNPTRDSRKEHAGE